MIEIHPPSDGGEDFQKALSQLSHYDWLLLTSQNTILQITKYLKKLPPHLKVVVVGPKTKVLAEQRGWGVATPSKSEGFRGLIDFFQNQEMRGQKILFPQSNIGRNEVVRALKKMGAAVTVVEAYQTLPSKIASETLLKILQRGLDGVLFFSPSQVKQFFDFIQPHFPLFQKVAFLPFGKTTASALQHLKIKPAFIPSESSEEALLAETKKYFKALE